VIPLVIDMGNADVMSTLIILKHEVEERLGTVMRMVFSGASESHLIAEEIGEIVLTLLSVLIQAERIY
jgi:hypothetical protein